ncbi:beta-propeller fold lactonase family protein [Falsiroseomonas sp. HW251]|uniref:YVTN family beta-propeller repeat protein n=1 Tax=Falsiroseomonas sp. HW251 TaxID=3390998 RepID=UPI003D312887
MRLRLLMLGLMLLAAPAARADLVFVLNSGDATVSVLDAATRQEVRRIPALREPHHLVLTPDGRQLVIADSGGNELLFVDPLSGEVRRRERISNPYHLEFSPDGKYLTVASLRRDQVDIYDATTLTLLQRFRPGDMPSHVAYSPDSRQVFVTLQGSRALAAFDLETRTHLWTVEVGREPAGVTWHRGRLIVGVMGEDHFVSVNPETREVTRAFNLGRGAHTIFPSPDGRALYATSRVDSRLAEVDPDTLQIRRVWNIPGGPDCLTFDPEGRIWMTLRWVGRVAILDPREAEWSLMRVGRSPHGIFFKPRRDGVGGDFPQRMSGAVSGSRPLPAPLTPSLPGPVTPASTR